MLKILLADDEELFRESLKQLIMWDKLNAVLYGEADNGETALELMKRQPPDIALVDINMPKLNGIDFIKKSKAVCPDTKIVIISGYDKFEYAQKAIRLGVSSYLLKPINEQELDECLRNLAFEIEQEKQHVSEQIRSRERVLKSQLIARRYYLKNLLFKEENKKRENMVNLGFEDNHDYIVLTGRMGTEENRFWQQYMETGAAEEIPEQYHLDVVEDDKKNLVFILSGEKGLIDRNMALELVQRVRGVLQENGLYQSTFGIGNMHEEVSGVYDSYQESLEVFPYDLSGSSSMVAEYQGHEGTEFQESRFLREQKLQLKKYMNQRDFSQIEQVIETIFESVYQENLPVDVVRIISIEILFPCVEKIYREKLRLSEEMRQKKMFKNLEEIKTYTELKTYILNEYRIECDYVKQDTAEKIPEKVKQVTDYIESYYSNEELSVGEISKKFFLNYNYLCVLFKKHMGMTINDYIFEVRMQNALNLMNASAVSVQEVAVSVGFLNVNYFSKCFKKKFGVPPSEYIRCFANT